MPNPFKNKPTSQDNEKLAKALKKKAFLVDVRTPGEFAEGHVQGSTNIPLDTVPENVKEFEDKDEIVVFCRSGSRSGKAKEFLENQGVKNILNGGGWKNVEQVKTAVEDEQ